MPKESFSHFKKRIRSTYDKIDKVHCPILNEDVYFNAKGFYHLNYEVTGRARTTDERVYKLYLVEHVAEVVKNATVIEESRLEKAPIGRKKKDGKKIIKDVIYSSIIGVVSGSPRVKLKVILRKVGNGRTIFWSVMKLKK